jgi:hypothetical protein
MFQLCLYQLINLPQQAYIREVHVWMSWMDMTKQAMDVKAVPCFQKIYCEWTILERQFDNMFELFLYPPLTFSYRIESHSSVAKQYQILI